MASPFDDDGQVDDDEFYEYNPHPYGGGYDISATYGAPLPPSPSTCYRPISVSAPAHVPAPPVPAPAPAPSMPRSPVPQQPPARKPPPIPTPTTAPVPVPAEPYHWPKPHDYGDAPRWGPAYYATPEVFRGWPYLPPPPAGPRCQPRCVPRDYWRQCMRGLDYLFGHSDGYGERRIGVDCHGVPVYANKKGAVEDAVVVEVPPPVTGHVQWHEPDELLPPDQSNLLSWEYDNVKQDTYACAQPTYDMPHDHSYSVHGVSNEPTLSWYDDAKEDAYAYAQPTYDSTSHQQSYSVHGVSDEPTWFPSQSYGYQDVYKQEESQYQDVLSSYGAENTISAQPVYCYNQNFSEQPLHIEVEPPETVYPHKLEYHENFSTYTNETNIDNSEASTHSCQIQPYVYVPDVPLEPYQPSWSRNLGYYEACTEEVAPEYDNHTLEHVGYGDMASLFLSSSYPQPVEVYQQSYSDDYVSRQNLHSSWDIFSEANSQISKLGDDCNHLNGSFWPFGEQSTYTV